MGFFQVAVHGLMPLSTFISIQDHTYFPETILNLLTENGSGFKAKKIVGMNMKELIDNVSVLSNEQFLVTRSCNLIVPSLGNP